MPAINPTYPLYPIVDFTSSALLLLTLATSFARQRWNLGVVFLCFWLFWDNVTDGINAILWADNYDIKLHAWCDFVSHVQLIAATIKPMCTLIIVRRLYLTTTLRPVELPGTREKRNNMIIEWTLGLVIPLIVAGPFYYIVQHARFEVVEGFGCQNAIETSVLSDLLMMTWSIIPPLISVAVYYPRVIWVFYQQRRDNGGLLRSNSSSRTNYFRILALASVDILFTLPSGIANFVVVNVKVNQAYDGHLPFYRGWRAVHADWAPFAVTYADLKAQQGSALTQFYLFRSTSPVLAFIIFALFGLTANARAVYWRFICAVGLRLGWKPAPQKPGGRLGLGTIEFVARPQEISLDTGTGLRSSYVDFGADGSRNDDKFKNTREAGHVPGVLAGTDSFSSVIDVGRREDRKTRYIFPREDSV